MTVPSERRNAVNTTRQFLLDLQFPDRTPGVPDSVREIAGRCLRHYPGEYYMELSREQLPKVWGDWKGEYVKEYNEEHLAVPEQGITPDAWVLLQWRNDKVFLLSEVDGYWRRSTSVENLNARDGEKVIVKTYSGSTYILNRTDETVSYVMREKLKQLKNAGSEIIKLEELI